MTQPLQNPSGSGPNSPAPPSLHPFALAPGTLPDAKVARRLRRRLLAWYGQNARELPWRVPPVSARNESNQSSREPNPISASISSPNPYHVLVSETMLQQTQVATVIAYFRRFIEIWPTLADLAAADEQDVLKQWEGLGYYRRARLLHAAARAVVDQHEGTLPDELDQLRALPGIGAYTAGAIASIAFGRQTAAVDGNVLRVLSRWFILEDDLSVPASARRFHEVAQSLVPAKRTGDWTQALMELGATVCTPRQPRCLTCPVRTDCTAHLHADPTTLPVKTKRVRVTAVTHTVVVAERRQRYLIQQRPDTGLWSGMWEFTTLERDAEPATVLQDTGLSAGTTADSLAFDHKTTHRAIAFEVHRLKSVTGKLRGAPNRRWATAAEVQSLPMPNPQRRIAAWLAKEREVDS